MTTTNIPLQTRRILQKLFVISITRVALADWSSGLGAIGGRILRYPAPFPQPDLSKIVSQPLTHGILLETNDRSAGVASSVSHLWADSFEKLRDLPNASIVLFLFRDVTPFR